MHIKSECMETPVTQSVQKGKKRTLPFCETFLQLFVIVLLAVTVCFVLQYFYKCIDCDNICVKTTSICGCLSVWLKLMINYMLIHVNLFNCIYLLCGAVVRRRRSRLGLDSRVPRIRRYKFITE